MYIIIGGGGDIGYYLTKSLLNQGHEVLLIEKSGERYASLNEELGTSVIRGDACEARTMAEVGANRADVVIAVTGDDEDNLVICQMAKKRYKVGRTIARVNNPKHTELFHKLGIDVTVSPTRAILSLIEAELPTSRFVQLMNLQNTNLELVELRVLADSPMVGKQIREISVPSSSTLILVVRNKQPILPASDIQILPDDTIFALVTSEGESELRTVFGAVD